MTYQLPPVFPLYFHPVLHMPFIATLSVLDAVQAASVQLELQDVLVKTGLKDRSRLLLGPFSCSSSLEARWCRHSGSPGPEPGPPKLLLDLKGGLLQVCINSAFSVTRFIAQFVEARVRSAPLHLVRIEGLAQGHRHPGGVWVRLLGLIRTSPYHKAMMTLMSLQLECQKSQTIRISIPFLSRVEGYVFPLEISKMILTVFISWFPKAQLITPPLNLLLRFNPAMASVFLKWWQ